MGANSTGLEGATSSETGDEATEQPETPPEAAVQESPEQAIEQQPLAQAIDVKGILSTTQNRVAEILTATEAAAADIVDAANAEAELIVRGTQAKAEGLAKSKIARIDAVTDRLLAKANGVADEIESLRGLIDRSLDSLATDLGIEDDAATTAIEPALAPLPNGDGPAEEQVPYEPRSGKPGGLLHRMRASTKRDASEGVKLLATQMIAAGHTWEEARVRLSDEFGVKDPTIALDAVYRDGEVTTSAD